MFEKNASPLREGNTSGSNGSPAGSRGTGDNRPSSIKKEKTHPNIRSALQEAVPGEHRKSPSSDGSEASTTSMQKLSRFNGTTKLPKFNNQGEARNDAQPDRDKVVDIDGSRTSSPESAETNTPSGDEGGVSNSNVPDEGQSFDVKYLEGFTTPRAISQKESDNRHNADTPTVTGDALDPNNNSLMVSPTFLNRVVLSTTPPTPESKNVRQSEEESSSPVSEVSDSRSTEKTISENDKREKSPTSSDETKAKQPEASAVIKQDVGTTPPTTPVQKFSQSKQTSWSTKVKAEAAVVKRAEATVVVWQLSDGVFDDALFSIKKSKNGTKHQKNGRNGFHESPVKADVQKVKLVQLSTHPECLSDAQIKQLKNADKVVFLVNLEDVEAINNVYAAEGFLKEAFPVAVAKECFSYNKVPANQVGKLCDAMQFVENKTKLKKALADLLDIKEDSIFKNTFQLANRDLIVKKVLAFNGGIDGFLDTLRQNMGRHCPLQLRNFQKSEPERKFSYNSGHVSLIAVDTNRLYPESEGAFLNFSKAIVSEPLTHEVMEGFVSTILAKETPAVRNYSYNTKTDSFSLSEPVKTTEEVKEGQQMPQKEPEEDGFKIKVKYVKEKGKVTQRNQEKYAKQAISWTSRVTAELSTQAEQQEIIKK